MMVTVAAIQMGSSPDIEENVQTALTWIAKAKEQGAQLIVLPENFATLGLSEEQSHKHAEVYQNGPIQQKLGQAAKEHRVWLIGGTLPIKSENKSYAACMMWDPNGEIVARYDKIHLFDVNVEGQESYAESAKVIPGDKIVLVDTPLGKIGLTVCYDVRFPELYRALMLRGADLIVVPSAFTIRTGKVHWETLLKARAIENLCYIIAPNQVGLRANGLGTYGHSMIISPWGEILANLQQEPGVAIAQIDLKHMQQIRNQFPSVKHYRSFVMAELVNEVKA